MFISVHIESNLDQIFGDVKKSAIWVILQIIPNLNTLNNNFLSFLIMNSMNL